MKNVPSHQCVGFPSVVTFSENFFRVKMSINLNKNKAQILDAWKKVTDHEDGYDWALYGYEGKSFDLKVVSWRKLFM